ncbi:MAG: FTR1 family protein [Candidatus Omnitrophica bacterium]|nr:FTR1 family protein [Candidatus Omnitrophota bacterium]
MFQAFVIVLREGFEAFLIVSIIISYLKRAGEAWLLYAVYWGIALSLAASGFFGWVMSHGVNEPLWEGILGLVAAVMVTTLVIQMWFQGRNLKKNMEEKLGANIASRASRRMAGFGVFLFTLFMITREGMETALMLIQVPQGRVIAGVLAGLAAVAVFCWVWVRFSRFINVRLFFQVTGIFLLLFVAQILIYSFHEFSEAGLLPNNEYWHLMTEPVSPDGIYGKWFPAAAVSVSALWLFVSRFWKREKK